MVALIKAIKFAHTEYGVKRVHQEVLSNGGKWEKVNIKRVKKHMKQLGLTISPNDQSDNDVIQLTTIGAESKSATENAIPIDDGMKNSQNWLPVKLDVPIASYEKFPFQASVNLRSSQNGDSIGQGGELFKIQTSALPMDAKHPMMLYNKARDRKTYIHFQSDAYRPLFELIRSQGKVGIGGGSKAFFWGRYSFEHKALFINVSEVAPYQEW